MELTDEQISILQDSLQFLMKNMHLQEYTGEIHYRYQIEELQFLLKESRILLTKN